MNTTSGSDHRKTLYLIDGMSQIFRAFFALPSLATSKGLPTNAIRGFTAMLRKIIQTHRPDYLGVAFDTAEPTFRHDSFADYKKDRPEMPEDLSVQLPYIRRVCAALRVPIIQFEKFEADDVIGTLARKGEGQDLDIVIVTQDKDMFQLVNDHVRVMRASRQGDETLYDSSGVEELMGLPPEKIVDYLGLCGDAVDNIPGAPGIGEKGARKLLVEFGSVEALLERWNEVANKRYSESLRDNRDLIMKSKDLATIRLDVPVELNLEELHLDPPDREAVMELFRELEFSTLLKEFDGESKSSAANTEVPASVDAPPPKKTAFPSLRKLDEVKECVASLKNEKSIAVSVRQVPRSQTLDTAAEIGLAGGKLGAVSVEVGSGDFWKKSGLAELLSGREVSKQVHDSKAVALNLERAAGVALKGVGEDTMLMSYLLNANESNHSLERVVRAHLQEELSPGPAAAANYTQRLVPVLRKEIDTLGLKQVYETVELPLADVLVRVEQNGMRVDEKVLAGLSAEFEAKLTELTRNIYQLAGTEFNINSPKQLGEILFEKLNLPSGKKSKKSGQYSTAIDVLEELATSYELPRVILEYRQIAKLKSTYVDALPKLIDPNTHRLHTSFNQTVAATGRLSSTEPNLQNIPVRTEAGRKIRSAFVAEQDFVLLSADYSQIELRLLAHFSEDAVLVDAFQRGEDIHARTAEEIFGVPRLMQTPDHRRQAKAINFGIVYGLSPFGLAQQLGISNADAKNYIEAYFTRYKGVKRFIERVLAETRKSGEVRTLLGRLRRIPDINSRNPSLRGFAERTAINTPLQGTAADLIKLAMIQIDRQLLSQDLKAKMMLQVHDELIFEVHESEVAHLRKLVKQGMEHVYKLRVPLIVDISVGKNWRDVE
ncbi:MAG: DNA polymerase I [Acidobacteriia bacterium]|nr:DNA polymerase I [Terriglobia bacterium]